METLKLEQRLVIKSTDVMTNFCWAYTNALLQKLIELDEKDKIFVDGINKALHMETDFATTYNSSVIEIAGAIMFEISKQINCQAISQSATPSHVAKLMIICREFLDIFKEKVVEEPNPETVERCVQKVTDFLEEAGAPDTRFVAMSLVEILQKQFSFVPKEVSNT